MVVSMRRCVLEGVVRRGVGRLAEVLELRRPYLHLGILDLRLTGRAGGISQSLIVIVRGLGVTEKMLLLDLLDRLPLHVWMLRRGCLGGIERRECLRLGLWGEVGSGEVSQRVIGSMV